MWLRSLSPLLAPVIWLSLAGCPGGAAGLGEPCSGHDSCDSRYQCVANVCAPRCQRGPECGDGYACSASGLCVLATGQVGDACKSETDCAPGLACAIDGTLPDEDKTVVSTCTEHNQGRPPGSACETDAQCSNHTCALGLCVDLCRETRDCISGTGCTTIPIVDNSVSPAMVGGNFAGCLPNRGSITWSIPVSSPMASIALPVPGSAQSATVVFQVSDEAQSVGATKVEQPVEDVDDRIVYDLGQCNPNQPPDETCTPQLARTQYFRNRLRHWPAAGQSVLQIPTRSVKKGSEDDQTVADFVPGGAYRIELKSFRPNGSPGSAIPRVTAIVKMDTSVNLDLNFHFLDLDDHPCSAAFGGGTLDAEVASTAPFFQEDLQDEKQSYLEELKNILAKGGIALNNTTYTDIRNRHDLDGLARENAGDLLSLGQHDSGIDVFFVRSLTPVGLRALGPNPGPAGLRGTPESGIVISIDSLCYDLVSDDPFPPWKKLARLTAYMIARYMGLFHTVELEHFLEIANAVPEQARQYREWTDPLVNTTDATTQNLMFFSEILQTSPDVMELGTSLTNDQRDILRRNAVLR